MGGTGVTMSSVYYWWVEVEVEVEVRVCIG
jgi:hypothetical protein